MNRLDRISTADSKTSICFRKAEKIIFSIAASFHKLFDKSYIYLVLIHTTLYEKVIIDCVMFSLLKWSRQRIRIKKVVGPVVNFSTLWRHSRIIEKRLPLESLLLKTEKGKNNCNISIFSIE